MTVEQFVDFVKFSLESELIKVTPVDKGGLKESVEVVFEKGELRIKMVEYGLYVEYGTQPHVIRPKNKKVLRWNKQKGSTTRKSTDIFAKKVTHPGTQPNPFIRNTMYHKLPGIVRKGAKKHLEGMSVEVEFQ